MYGVNMSLSLSRYFIFLHKSRKVGLTLPDEPKIEGKKQKAVKELKPAGWHPRYD